MLNCLKKNTSTHARKQKGLIPKFKLSEYFFQTLFWVKLQKYLMRQNEDEYIYMYTNTSIQISVTQRSPRRDHSEGEP